MLHFKTVILKKISIFYDSIYFALEPKKKIILVKLAEGCGILSNMADCKKFKLMIKQF